MSNTILKKTIPELTSDEQKQLSQLILRYYPTAHQLYIDQRTKVDNGFDVILIKNGDTILAVHYLKIIKLLTPFSEKPLPVVHFGQALKHESFKGNVIWKLGSWYARKELGYLFHFKKAIGVSTIVSPKVYENFIKLYPSSYPSPSVSSGEELKLLPFINNFFQRYRKINIEVDQEFCYDYPHIQTDEITDDWDRFYKAKNPEINKMFIDKGIIQFENNRIFKGAKHLVACGFRSPLRFKKSTEILLEKDNSRELEYH